MFFSGNAKIIELLIKAGANVNAKNEDGWSAAYYALLNGSS